MVFVSWAIVGRGYNNFYFYTQLYISQIVNIRYTINIFSSLIDGLSNFNKCKIKILSVVILYIHHIIRSKNLMIISYYLIVFIPSILNFYFTDYTLYIGFFAIVVYFFFYKYSVR